MLREVISIGITQIAALITEKCEIENCLKNFIRKKIGLIKKRIKIEFGKIIGSFQKISYTLKID